MGTEGGEWIDKMVGGVPKLSNLAVSKVWYGFNWVTWPMFSESVTVLFNNVSLLSFASDDDNDVASWGTDLWLIDMQRVATFRCNCDAFCVIECRHEAIPRTIVVVEEVNFLSFWKASVYFEVSLVLFFFLSPFCGNRERFTKMVGSHLTGLLYVKKRINAGSTLDDEVLQLFTFWEQTDVTSIQVKG